ncbi:MAG: hypothetical protein US81_C0005G0002 [Parcubacteria group bacterium GW2011_GWE2_38_18]|nr:MAG: hypothetical protein US81_C0005G0002 [Parcubacteria group bacterium GW2011_GWE2_38_18]
MEKLINCPYCGSKMKSGSLEIHGSWLGFLLVGLSYQNLFYKPFDEKFQEYSSDEETVIKESEILKAMKCTKCKAISFIPGETTDIGMGIPIQ